MLGMADGQVVFVIVNVADVMVAVLKEDCGGSKVVGGGVQAHDEAAGEQVLTPHLVLRLWVDEDVGEGSGRVADIATPVKDLEQFT